MGSPYKLPDVDTNNDQLSAQVAETTEVPPQSVLLLWAKLHGSGNIPPIQEGLIEHVYSLNSPKHILAARCLSGVQQDNKVLLQVMNVSPDMVKIYRGTKLGDFTPLQYVHVIDDQEMFRPDVQCAGDMPSVDLSTTALNATQRAELIGLLKEFGDIFAAQDGSGLGCTTVVQHEIKTDGPPIRQPVRRLPTALKPVINAEVEKMLQQGVIRPSNSPWSSPIVMVRKKDGSWRFCVDYRKVNLVTCRDAYPLPRIDSTLDTLAGATLFTTLDLATGYWQVEIKEEDKE